MEEKLIGGCALVSLPVRGDARGNLVAIEGERDLPFPIARVYYLYGSGPESRRGFHAHRHLQQLAVCVGGACTFVLDDGRDRCEIRLDRPDTGLHIASMVWREMRDFSPDCVLLVLASQAYDEADYIRDYDRFLAESRTP